jgi:hypothetical protein
VTTALTKDEYLATFIEPMRRLEADESSKPVRRVEGGAVLEHFIAQLEEVPLAAA